MSKKSEIRNPKSETNSNFQNSKLKIFLAPLSSICLIVSYPNFNLWPLAWIALISLFFALENQRPLKAFLIAYLAGVLFFMGTVHWLIHVTLPGMIVVVLYLALYFGLFGLLYSYIVHRISRIAQLFIVPAAWVTTEWLRANVFGGFGWSLLGHSQSWNLPAIQIADITGAYGVSYLIVLVNMAAYLIIRGLRKKEYYYNYGLIAIFLVFLCLGYGVYRLNSVFTGEKLKVAVIQGNIPQAKKWDLDFREEILNKYERLTRQAAEEKPDIVIWPETSVPGYFKSEEDLADRIKTLARDINTPILVGAPRQEWCQKDTYYNSAILLAEDGRVIDIYDKVHLVPFGEYVPAKNLFSFIQKFSMTMIGDFTAGKDYTIFKFLVERAVKEKDVTWKLIKKVKFSCLICFEDVFPDLTREFVKRGAGFLVNITNDAWFNMSSAPYQHAQSSVLRAVENRVNVVRAANTGFSCFIDQKGRVVAAVESEGRNLFVEGFKTHEITLTNTRAFYTVYGDLFAHICMLLTVASLIYPRKFLSKITA